MVSISVQGKFLSKFSKKLCFARKDHIFSLIGSLTQCDIEVCNI